MRSLQTTKLYVPAAGVQGVFTLPPNCIRIDLVNHADVEVRWSTTPNVVNAATLSLPNQFRTLGPGARRPGAYVGLLTSGSLYYAGDVEGSRFDITPYVE